MKNARRKLEIPRPAAMPYKTLVNCRGETCRNIGKLKTKYACIVDAEESMRIRLESVPHKYHEGHISAKGINSLSHCNLVHKFIPRPEAKKYWMQRHQWRKNGKNLRKYPHGSWLKSEKRGDRRSKEQGRKSSFCVIDGSLSSQEFGVRASLEAYSEVTLWRMLQDRVLYSLSRDHQHHNWQPQKSWTLYHGLQDVQDKHQMQYPLTPRSEWKMHQRYWKFQSQNARIFGYVYQSTNGPNHGPAYKI